MDDILDLWEEKMKIILNSIEEEVISTKTLNSFKIIAKYMTYNLLIYNHLPA